MHSTLFAFTVILTSEVPDRGLLQIFGSFHQSIPLSCIIVYCYIILFYIHLFADFSTSRVSLATANKSNISDIPSNLLTLSPPVKCGTQQCVGEYCNIKLINTKPRLAKQPLGNCSPANVPQVIQNLPSSLGINLIEGLACPRLYVCCQSS